MKVSDTPRPSPRGRNTSVGRRGKKTIHSAGVAAVPAQRILGD